MHRIDFRELVMLLGQSAHGCPIDFFQKRTVFRDERAYKLNGSKGIAQNGSNDQTVHSPSTDAMKHSTLGRKQSLEKAF